MIYAGSRAVAAAYLGSTPLSEIWLGGALVWAGFRRPGAASLHLILTQAAAGTAVTLVPLRADTRLTPGADVSGTAQAVVDTSARHDIPLTMYLPTAQVGAVSPLTAEQTLALVMTIPAAQGVTLHPLAAEQAVSLTMTIPSVRSVVLNPIAITQDFAVTMPIPSGYGVTLHPLTLQQAFAGKMAIPSAQGVTLNPLTLTQAAALTMPIPGGQGVELHPVTAQQAVTAHLPAAEGADITVSPGQASQAEPLTMRASGVPVQVMPGAADHVLPPVVGDIAPEMLTAQDGAAPERVKLAMSAEAKAIYPRFIQRGDTVYIYRPMRWRQEGDTVYLDYTEAAWEAPEEDGDALIVRQVYSAAENGDYLEVT